MIKDTYKSLFDKIEPSDDLIQLTKQRMKQEEKKSSLSFFKYGAIAACFIFAIVLTVPYMQKTANNMAASESIMQDSIGAINEDTSITKDFVKPNFSGMNSIDSVQNSGEMVEKSNDFNLLDKIIAFIKNLLNL